MKIIYDLFGKLALKAVTAVITVITVIDFVQNRRVFGSCGPPGVMLHPAIGIRPRGDK